MLVGFINPWATTGTPNGSVFCFVFCCHLGGLNEGAPAGGGDEHGELESFHEAAGRFQGEGGELRPP